MHPSMYLRSLLTLSSIPFHPILESIAVVWSTDQRKRGMDEGRSRAETCKEDVGLEVNSSRGFDTLFISVCDSVQTKLKGGIERIIRNRVSQFSAETISRPRRTRKFFDPLDGGVAKSAYPLALCVVDSVHSSIHPSIRTDDELMSFNDDARRGGKQTVGGFGSLCLTPFHSFVPQRISRHPECEKGPSLHPSPCCATGDQKEIKRRSKGDQKEIKGERR